LKSPSQVELIVDLHRLDQHGMAAGGAGGAVDHGLDLTLDVLVAGIEGHGPGCLGRRAHQLAVDEDLDALHRLGGRDFDLHVGLAENRLAGDRAHDLPGDRGLGGAGRGEKEDETPPGLLQPPDHPATPIATEALFGVSSACARTASRDCAFSLRKRRAAWNVSSRTEL
jgi:hypothetical protein